MRTIKFRAWDTDYNPPKMWQWEDIQEFVMNMVLSDEACHPMQFTGLCDKNGVEIYEGDVLCHTTTIRMGFSVEGKNVYSVIVFSRNNTQNSVLTSYMGFWAKRGEDDLTSISYLTDTLMAVVIGNIFQTPELIEADNGK